MVLVFAAVALYGCAGWSTAYQQGYKKGYNALYVDLVGPAAKRVMEKTKKDIRIVTYVQPALQKEFSVQVSKASGVDLPDLTADKLEAVKKTVVEYLVKNGWVVRDEAPLSLVVTINPYKEGTPVVLKGIATSVTYGAKKFPATEIGGNLLLIKDGSQILLDMPIPIEATDSTAWSLKPDSQFSVGTVREVFSQIIILILNDYWDRKLIKTSS